MKILVTGGTGYIGSHTVIELLNAGHEVEIIDNLCNSSKTALDAIEKITGIRPVFYEIDLCNKTDLKKIFKDSEKTNRFDAVIHFAGLKAVGESVEQPLKYYNNNLVSTLNLLDCMAEYNVKQLIFSSSATVYGNPGDGACTEDLPTGQGIASPYGKTKYMIEEILKDVAAADSTFQIALLRYFNPVGAHPSGLIGEDFSGRPNNLMPIIMKVDHGDYPELSVYGDDYPTPDGTCIRDYIHVVDVARGHLAALAALRSGAREWNLGTGKGTSVLEMISAFEKASGKKLPYKIAPRRAGDLPKLYANPARAASELGWKATLTIDDAMRDTINYLEHLKA
ncbi:UDP-glucose 4-epimerase GalE [Candidatus Saccharibacteria bacterium]|nr:UDP-glucose 4-epimerase GalE [Candidatus Saccharibacteria bacterium]